MKLRGLLAACALLATGAVGAAESDVVNERIPVPRLALEQHWQIDCARLLQSYEAARQEQFKPVKAEELAELIREANLCSYVHNVSASGISAETCPDYTAISAVLQGLRQLREVGGDVGAWQAPPISCD